MPSSKLNVYSRLVRGILGWEQLDKESAGRNLEFQFSQLDKTPLFRSLVKSTRCSSLFQVTLSTDAILRLSYSRFPVPRHAF